jgi:hypothetical protein
VARYESIGTSPRLLPVDRARQLLAGMIERGQIEQGCAGGVPSVSTAQLPG